MILLDDETRFSFYFFSFYSNYILKYGVSACIFMYEKWLFNGGIYWFLSIIHQIKV